MMRILAVAAPLFLSVGMAGDAQRRIQAVARAALGLPGAPRIESRS